MDKKLNIAFFWHMHQPLYKDPFTSEFVLPWVLFHGTKDYYDMVEILDSYPSVRQTFNLVPSLVEQLLDYASGNASDRYQRVSAKEATLLTPDEKQFILEYFFQAHHERMIGPLKRYDALLKKRGLSSDPADIRQRSRWFNSNDFLDLQVFFNLVWVDPSIRDRDKFLAALYSKGGGYTEEDKRGLLKKQIEIIRWILPKYREMEEKGIVELTTSPYYHPILPLLCDSDSARAGMPDATLPRERFMNPSDASRQLQKGIELHERTFGRAPRGLWPPEGSVSMDIIPLLDEHGIKWIASDEDILARTLGTPVIRDREGNCKSKFLYRPHRVSLNGSSVSMVFRDRVLSDLIGFEYARWAPDDAARDLVGRLERIYDFLSDSDPEDHIVSIVLDGENAWEGYQRDGRDFLEALYSRLSDNPKLECVTIGGFLDSAPEHDELDSLFPGSWINRNFRVWIGQPEDNTAWDLIATARKAVEEADGALEKGEVRPYTAEDVRRAWDEIYASEGSDWFWWYGDEHASMSDKEFDELFRAHLKKAYTLIKSQPPSVLDIPIITEERGLRPLKIPVGFINPVLDGEITNWFEWLSAGRLERTFISGAMHRGGGGGGGETGIEADANGEGDTGGLIEGVSYGFNLSSLFLRLDYLKRLRPYDGKWSFTVVFLHPEEVKVHTAIHGKKSFTKITGPDSVEKPAPGEIRTASGGASGGIGAASGGAAADRVVELEVPFKALGAKSGDELRLFIEVDGGQLGMERWPAKGFLIVDVPAEDFERKNWIV